jgi:tRNA threonylcarbamoyl adenosine modification protein (Sua5/YciO/YrdC/YwlC family)
MRHKILLASPVAWEEAAGAIERGDLVVFPTDTVYGVACDPYNADALQKIYEAKGRPEQKAIPLLLAGPEVLEKVAGKLGMAARALAEEYWPGALTMVVPRNPGLPAQLGTGGTIAVRVPDHDGLRAFLAVCGGALAATSANRSGEPDALDATRAAGYLGDHIAIYIDDGPSPGGRPSTVVDCTGESLRILREGDITVRQIREIAGEVS